MTRTHRGWGCLIALALVAASACETTHAAAPTHAPTPTCPPTPAAKAGPRSSPGAQGHWQVVPAVTYANPYTRLNAAIAIDAQDAWAVGVTGEQHNDPGGPMRPIAQHWDGIRWTDLPTPPVPQHSAALSGVSAVGSRDVWAVGYAYNGSPGTAKALLEHWNGTCWTLVPGAPAGNATGQRLAAVAAVSADDVWAVGQGTLGDDASRPALIEHWDGRHWTQSPLPPLPAGSDSDLNALSVRSATDIWAVGETIDRTHDTAPDGAPGCPLALRWDGRTWSNISTPCPPPSRPPTAFYGVLARGPADVWALGDLPTTGNNGQDLARSKVVHWDGTTWKKYPAPATTFMAGAVNDGHGGFWVTGTTTDAAKHDHEHIYHWTAGQWTITEPVPSGPGSPSIGALATVPGTSTLWAVGGMATRPPDLPDAGEARPLTEMNQP